MEVYSLYLQVLKINIRSFLANSGSPMMVLEDGRSISRLSLTAERLFLKASLFPEECSQRSPNDAYVLGHHNRDILTNRLTAVIDMSLPVITAVNRNHLVTMVTGYDR